MKKSTKRWLSLALTLVMLLGMVPAFAPAAKAGEEQMESFVLDNYKHYDEFEEVYYAVAHTGTNVTVSPTVDDIYAWDGGWYLGSSEDIRVTVSNGDVIRKLVVKTDESDTATLTAGNETISGTKSDNVDAYVYTYEGVNEAEAVFSGPGTIVFQIDVYYGDPVVPVTDVTLDKTTATLTVGYTETLTATVLPDNATDKSVTWASNNEAVATVADGVVTAVAAGTANITVTTTDGNKTATCVVTVNAPPVIDTWEKLKSALAAGGDIILGDNVTAGENDTKLTVPSGVTATLDLNGHTINANNKFSVLTVEGSLTLNDNSDAGSGKLTGGKASNGGGVYINRNGTFTMSGGSIADNTTTNRGGGGGVFIFTSGTFTMSDGSIAGNTASKNGGGVYIYGGTFTMSGGSITGNTATTGNGGGVYHNGEFKISGDVTITGNNADNVYLNSKIITVTDTLAATSKIGVNNNGSTVFTSDLSEKGTINNFFSDTNNFCIVEEDGEAKLGAKYTVTFMDEDGTTVLAAAQTVVDGGKATEPDPAPTKEGYNLMGWKLNAEDESYFNFATEITENITLTAAWEINKYTVTFVDEDGETVLKEATQYDYGTPAANIEKPADPTKEGYTFVGWTLNGEDYDFSSTITEDITLTAKWTLNLTHHEAVNPTCTEDGNIEYWQDDAGNLYSDSNGETPVEDVTDPATGHTLGGASWSWTKVGDSFTAQLKQVCTVCGDIVTTKADVTTNETDSAIIYTATATLNGETYTSEKSYQKSYTLTVNGGTVDNEKDGYSYGEMVVVTADETDSSGKYFSGWYKGDNKVSEKLKFTFTVTNNTTLTAKYEADAEITPSSVLSLTMTDRIDAGSSKEKVSFTTEWAVPAGYKFVSAGIVRNYDSSENLTVEAASKVNKTLVTTSSGSYKYNLTMSATTKLQTLYAKGFLTYKDADGTTHTVYTDLYTSVYNQSNQ